MMIRQAIVSVIGALAVAITGAGPTTAQDYPSRPVTIIVPFAAGGTTDVIARIVGEHMSRTLGQQFIVENVVGAGGTTGSIRAMRANPDGYTIELANMGTHAAAVALYPSLAYNPEVDFAPIGMVAGLPVVIVGKKDLPPNDLKEFASYVRANADKLNMAHAGVGSITHFTCLLLNSILGVKPTMVPFSGAAPSAIRRCRTCRRPRRPGFRNSRHRPGTACLRPRGHRSRSSTSSATRSTRRLMTRIHRSACSTSAAKFQRRHDAVSSP
jgi:tripartite-type tricarboxylate transporter receptor subunit TctC